MKALVTGARGFIGSFLVEELLRAGFEVRCLLRGRQLDLKWLSGLDVKIVAGDVTEPRSLHEAVLEADYVFHLAALTKAINRAEFDRVNVYGTRNLLDAVRERGASVQRFVLVSSLAAAGPSRHGRPLTESDPDEPVSIYGRSKLAAEEVALEYLGDFPVSIVRPPAVFGPRDTDVLSLFKYAKHGWQPIIGRAARYASLIYVKDLVQGIMLVGLEEKSQGQVYYLCNDEPSRWDRFGNILAQVVGRKSRTLIIPGPAAFLVSAAFEMYRMLSRRPTLFGLDKYRELRETHWICDNSKAKSELGFETRFDLKDALEETMKWYVDRGWI